MLISFYAEIMLFWIESQYCLVEDSLRRNKIPTYQNWALKALCVAIIDSSIFKIISTANARCVDVQAVIVTDLINVIELPLPIA